MRDNHQFLHVNGIRMKVIIEGEGPDVVLLHGFPDSAHSWRNQVPALVQAGYRVIVPDLRGCGETEAPAGRSSYKIDMLTADILGMMDALSIGKAFLVGHDLGAFIGWNFIMDHPERVERFMAVGVGHPSAYQRGGIEQKLKAWYILLFQFPIISELIIRTFKWRFIRAFTQNHPEADQWIREKSRPGRLTASLNWYRANVVRALLGRFRHVSAPVFGIWSTGEIYVTENQMKKSTLYVDGPWRYERIENSSHWIQLDVPEKLNRLLIEYLKQPL